MGKDWRRNLQDGTAVPARQCADFPHNLTSTTVSLTVERQVSERAGAVLRSPFCTFNKLLLKANLEAVLYPGFLNLNGAS